MGRHGLTIRSAAGGIVDGGGGRGGRHPERHGQGVRSGAGTVVGVLTGNSSRQDLDLDGVVAVVASIREASDLILARRPR